MSWRLALEPMGRYLTGISQTDWRLVLRASLFYLSAALMIGMPWPAPSYAFIIGAPAPEITGGPWLNSKPLRLNDLKGRIVLLEFWTYG